MNTRNKPISFISDLHGKTKNPTDFYFYCKNDLFSRWLADFCGFSIDNYKTKGSVSHLALVAARNMGCNPIILTGQDLAFTDGKIYSSGSFWGDIYCFNEKNELDLLPETNKNLATCKKTEISIITFRDSTATLF